MSEAHQTIIIKRIKKVSGGGHSGGAWKVAYADFVTAMMAFFLLLWLLNSVTQEQLEGISNYFAPASISATKSGSGAVLGGQSVSQPIGALSDVSQQQAVAVDLPPPVANENQTKTQAEISKEQAEAVLKEKEQEQFDQVAKKLKEAIENDNEFKGFAKNLVVENTPEGMRIQVVDEDGLAMFPSGSSKMFDHTRKVLNLVANAIREMPQDISIAGHTDAKKFGVGANGYSNWELSADRANASRRALVQLGVPTGRITKVVGSAAKEPLLTDDPENPRNRRIAIVLLRGTGQQQAPAAGTGTGAGGASAPGLPGAGSPAGPIGTDTGVAAPSALDVLPGGRGGFSTQPSNSEPLSVVPQPVVPQPVVPQPQDFSNPKFRIFDDGRDNSAAPIPAPPAPSQLTVPETVPIKPPF